jgi:hypothetical protein
MKMNDDMMNMNDSKNMDPVQSKESQLQLMHELQSKLGTAWEREIAEQKENDAKAMELMESDPSGHIEMMKMERFDSMQTREQ